MHGLPRPAFLENSPVAASLWEREAGTGAIIETRDKPEPLRGRIGEACTNANI
jgi:hypothetical protein